MVTMATPETMGSLDNHYNYQSDSSSLTSPPPGTPEQPQVPEEAKKPPQRMISFDSEPEKERERRKSSLMKGPARDGGWGWVIVFGSFMCNMIVVGFGDSFAVLYMFLFKTFPKSEAYIIWVGSAQLGIYYLIGPIVSAMVNKYGCRKVTILGAVITMAGFLISTQSNTLAVMVVSYGIVGGIGYGMIYLPSIVIVGHWFESRRAFATGLAVSGSGIGAILVPRLAKYLYTEYTWQGGLVIMAGLVFHCAFFGSLYRPLAPLRMNRPPRGVMHRGSIMTALIAAKKRDRTISNGSLDNCIITRDNKIIMIDCIDRLNTNKLNQLIKDSRGISAASLGRSKHKVLNKIVQNGVVYSTGRPRLKTAIPSYLIHKPIAPPPPTRQTTAHSLNDITTLKVNSEQCNDTVLAAKSRSYHCVADPHPTDSTTTLEDRLSVQSHGDGPGSSIPDTRLVTETVHLSLPRQPSRNTYVNTAVVADAGYYSVPVSRCNSSNSLRQRLNRSTRSLTDSTNQVIPAAIVGASLNSMPRYSYSSGPTECYYEEDRSLFCHIKEIISDYLGTRLLTSYTFLTTVLVFSLSTFGFFVPVGLLAKLSKDKLEDLEMEDAVFLTSVMGVADTIGRLLSGWLADRPWMDALHLSNCCVVMAGLFTCFIPCFAQSFSQMAAFAACFGLCMSVHITLRSIILVDLFGIHRLASSFGLIIFFLGVCVFAATPLIEIVMIENHDLCDAFYIGGVCMLVGGILGFPLRHIRDWEAKRREKVEMIIEELNFESTTDSDRDLIEGDFL